MTFPMSPVHSMPISNPAHPLNPIHFTHPIAAHGHSGGTGGDVSGWAVLGVVVFVCAITGCFIWLFTRGLE